MSADVLGAENSISAAPGQEAGKTVLDQGSATALALALQACLRLHRQMGIDRYPVTPELRNFLHPRRAAAPAKKPVPGTPPAARPAGARPQATARPTPRPDDHLAAVRRDIEGCRLCPRGEAAYPRLSGLGEIGASLLVLGDYCSDPAAPAGTVFGVEEDSLLWKMMQAIGLGPQAVYVTNVIKCPCPEAAEPLGEPACLGYLQQEIALVQPRLILAMGAAAARAALGREVSLVRARGRLQRSRFVDASGHPLAVMVSFHPRSLLEQPAMKKAAWQDLQMLQRQMPTPTVDSGASGTGPAG